jgi:hypothetical protein
MSQKENEPLELTDEMLERNDTIYNTVLDCICTLAERKIEWDMQIIGEVTDAIISTLHKHEIQVRYPGITTEKDGS